MHLTRNLAAGLSLLALRRVDVSAFAATQGQAVALAALTVAIACAGTLLLTEPPRAFHLAGIERQGTSFLFALALAWLAARVVRRPELLLPILVARLAVGIWLWIFATAAYLAFGRAGSIGAEWAWPLWIGLFVWDLALALRVVQLLTGLSVARTLGIGVVYASASVALAFQLPDNRLWYSTAAQSPAPRPRPTVDAEALLYAQPDRLAAALDALKPQRAGAIDLYAVVFGADARPGPHRTEAEFARTVLEQRFDAAGRSLALVNHEDTRDVLPLATATNLRRAIAGIGERLDPAEDVLLVFLTGHGSQERGVGVWFPRLPLNDVAPADLAAMLDDAGIRWRVVVVSACHSGVFVEPLRGPETLVVTASAGDRKSFGCAPDQDLTYFGRAFFAEALAKSRSLPAAFADASARIEAREVREEKTPSRPQMAAGAQIVAWLEDLERQLGADAPAPEERPRIGYSSAPAPDGAAVPALAAEAELPAALP